MTPKSVAFYTLGCKLNYSETSSIQRLFEDNGFFVNAFDDGADVYVINTCSVTDFADQKCRQIVRRALRHTPQSLVVVVGCYAQLKPQEIADIPGHYVQPIGVDPGRITPRELRGYRVGAGVEHSHTDVKG